MNVSCTLSAWSSDVIGFQFAGAFLKELSTEMFSAESNHTWLFKTHEANKKKKAFMLGALISCV